MMSSAIGSMRETVRLPSGFQAGVLRSSTAGEDLNSRKRALIRLPYFDELQLWLVRDIDRNVEIRLHRVSQSLNVDGNVDRFLLQDFPDVDHRLVTPVEVGIRRETVDHAVDLGIGIARAIPGALPLGL